MTAIDVRSALQDHVAGQVSLAALLPAMRDVARMLDAQSLIKATIHMRTVPSTSSAFMTLSLRTHPVRKQGQRPITSDYLH
ncbi:hypothetical protein [Paraburkholderia youngii]|uniref:Uncharacterized protein n=1 Tax=Paraburkholderia youngii TaxID=2782701 RepID=A0A7Y6N264_9BURK|nr:hypothetical protein [Paraburkholderia youngii]NUY04727.1 hypothetical protein [Paraburkholderia youngii]